MPALDLPMRILSGMGEESFYIVVIPFLYWCIHRKVGFRLFLFLLVSVIINAIGKWSLHLPRPYWIDANIRAMYVETGFGAPSGHSQNALGVWTYLALLLHRFMGVHRFYYIAGILAILISFSRLYLGVHFPHDILSGWLIAALLIACFLYLQERTSNYTHTGSHLTRTLILFFSLTGTLTIIAWIVQQNPAFTIPALWQKNALKAHLAMGKNISISPYSIKTVVSSMALLIGSSVALPLSFRIGNFDPGGPWTKRILRYVLGLLIFFGLYIGLAKLFPKEHENYYYVFRALRYIVLSFWVLALAPWIFLKSGLANRRYDA